MRNYIMGYDFLLILVGFTYDRLLAPALTRYVMTASQPYRREDHVSRDPCGPALHLVGQERWEAFL